MQIQVKQIANFPDLPTKDQVAILYDLVLRMLANESRLGIPITDPVLLQFLPAALAAMNNQLNTITPPTPQQ